MLDKYFLSCQLVSLLTHQGSIASQNWGGLRPPTLLGASGEVADHFAGEKIVDLRNDEVGIVADVNLPDIKPRRFGRLRRTICSY